MRGEVELEMPLCGAFGQIVRWKDHFVLGVSRPHSGPPSAKGRANGDIDAISADVVDLQEGVRLPMHVGMP